MDNCASYADVSFKGAVADVLGSDDLKAVSCGQSIAEAVLGAGRSLPTVARFSTVGPSPRLTEAVLLAERVHAALVELSDGSPIFTGCDGLGHPLSGHPHAYILSESNAGLGQGQGGVVTHVTVYSKAGFGSRERAALAALREVYGSGLHVGLALMGLGSREDFGGLDIDKGKSPLLGESRSWVSRTPFVPTRHPKVTRAGQPRLDPRGLQIGGPEHELWRLLLLAGFPEPVAVETVAGTMLGGREVAWREFVCRRSGGDGRRAAYDRGYGFRIEFPRAVRGPIAVGYGGHFGVGGFEGDD